MRPSAPTRNFARRRLFRFEPADRRPAMNTRSGPGSCSATGPGSEAAVEREIARLEAQPVELPGRRRQQGGLVREADLRRRGQDQAAGAAARVLAQLGDLHDIAELGRLAQLALADRARVGVGEGHEPVGDLLARDTLADLPGHLLGALDELLEPPRGCELGLRAAAASPLT